MKRVNEITIRITVTQLYTPHHYDVGLNLFVWVDLQPHLSRGVLAIVPRYLFDAFLCFNQPAFMIKTANLFIPYAYVYTLMCVCTYVYFK